MKTSIDEMIDIISETRPEFLDVNDKLHNRLYDYISHLIILSKLLCSREFLSKKTIDIFTNNFYNFITELVKLSENDDTVEMSYDYINEFYTSMRDYLEVNEEYELCANFTNFINAFNDKVDYINEQK
jgi:hypothetical protein